MKLNQLAPARGSAHKSKRLGRGLGSGKGKTAGRGTKGYKARSGASLGGFEGGQTPIHMRLPKRGFSNARFRKKFAIINLGRLQQAVDDKKLDPSQPITREVLLASGLLRRASTPVRLLGKGTLKTALTLEAAAASAEAKKAFEAAGGKLKLTAPKASPPPKPKQEGA